MTICSVVLGSVCIDTDGSHLQQMTKYTIRAITGLSPTVSSRAPDAEVELETLVLHTRKVPSSVLGKVPGYPN
jgi:hypothetical protein